MNASYRHPITVNLAVCNTKINSNVSIISSTHHCTLLSIESSFVFAQMPHLKGFEGTVVKNAATIMLGSNRKFRHEFRAVLISAIRMMGIQTDPALN